MAYSTGLTYCGWTINESSIPSHTNETSTGRGIQAYFPNFYVEYFGNISQLSKCYAI